jgi:hypothetical protein
LKERLECSLHVEKVKFTKDMETMATDGHCRGSERSHIIGEKGCQRRWHKEEDESRGN